MQGTQERLEADLCAECERRFGTKVKLEITLTRTEQTVRAEKVLVILPAASEWLYDKAVKQWRIQKIGKSNEKVYCIFDDSDFGNNDSSYSDMGE